MTVALEPPRFATPDLLTTATCLACDRRPAVHGTLACRGCRITVTRDLTDIPELFGQLDSAPGSGMGPGRGAPGFGSRSPARDTVLVLLDRRPQTFDPDHPHRLGSVTAMLDYWLDLADISGWPSVAGRCTELRRRLDDLVQRWWWGDFATAITATARHLRRANSEHEQTTPLGECPTPMPGMTRMVLAGDTWRSEPILCGGVVRARESTVTARCGRCGMRWSGLAELRTLGDQLGDAMLDLPGLSRYLAFYGTVIPLATLRSWAQRAGWRRERAGGRTLYSLADARDSAFVAWDRRHRLLGPEQLPGPSVPPGWGWTLLPVLCRVPPA